MQNKEYLEFFNKFIQPYVKEFEKIRYNYLAWFIFIYVFAVILMLAAFCRLDIINNLHNMDKWGVFIFCICFCIGFAHPKACMMVTRYRSVIKDKFLKYMFKHMYGLKYYNPNPTVWSNIMSSWGYNSPKNHIDLEELYNLKIIDFVSGISFDDYISGKYKDLQIDIQELSVRKNVGRSVVSVFHGLIMSVDFNKKFSDRILFFSDKAIEQRSTCTKGVKIETEDIEFNKMFNIYSKDQIESRYIFTPVFIEKIKTIALQNPCYNINGEFYNGKLYIIISSPKNWFEIPFFKPANNPAVYYQPVNDLQNLLSIVDSVLQAKSYN